MKDLSSMTGQSVHTLKYYFRLGLIAEIGRSPSTNFRYFDDSTVTRLRSIRELRTKGFSLKKIKERFNNHELLPNS